MKIITNDCVYVQKNDIAVLAMSDLSIPASIFLSVFDFSKPSIINDRNRYEFVEFYGKKEINFFKELSWIIDYYDIKNLSEDEIIDLGQSIAQEKNEIAKKFNAMSDEEKEENKDMIQQSEFLNFKMYSLRDFLYFKRGRINMELPEGIEPPIDFEKSKKGAKKMIKSIFHKDK